MNLPSKTLTTDGTIWVPLADFEDLARKHSTQHNTIVNYHDVQDRDSRQIRDLIQQVRAQQESLKASRSLLGIHAMALQEASTIIVELRSQLVQKQKPTDTQSSYGFHYILRARITKQGLSRIPDAKEGDVFPIKSISPGGGPGYWCAHVTDIKGNVWSLGEGDWTPVGVQE